MAEEFLIKTARTWLRPLTIADAEDFYALNLDPEVVRYTGDMPFKSAEDAKEFLAKYDQYEKYRVGRWAVIEKRNSKFIGWCGLKYCPESNEYDIGFRFYRDYWNQGFATETAQRCLVYGFEELKLKRIVGRAMVANTGSIRVLEKIGMRFLEQFDFDGEEGVIYDIKA